MKKLSNLLKGVLVLSVLYLTIGLWLHSQFVDVSTVLMTYSNIAVGIEVGSLILAKGVLITLVVSWPRLAQETAVDCVWPEIAIMLVAFGWSNGESGVIFFRPQNLVWIDMSALALLGLIYIFASTRIEQRFQDKTGLSGEQK